MLRQLSQTLGESHKAEYSTKYMFCPSCGNKIQQKWQHCAICGALVEGLGSSSASSNFSGQHYQSMVVMDNESSFSWSKVLVSVFLVTTLLSVSAFVYFEYLNSGLISEGSKDIQSGDYEIIYLDSVENIEWNVTYYDAEWPKSFAEAFPEADLPEASLVHSNGNLYFFSGTQYYRYSQSTGTVDKVGQIGVDGWYNLPQDMDAALLYSNNKAYFFKGDNYYRYVNGDVDKIGEIGVDGWEGIPTHLDAAIPDGSDGAYFFKGQLIYHYQDGLVTITNLGESPFLGLQEVPNAAWKDGGQFITHTGDRIWITENAITGWAPAYDILFFDEDGCSAWVRGETPQLIDELSRQGIQESTSASGKVSKGDYCLVIDNSNRFSSSINGREITVGWNVYEK